MSAMKRRPHLVIEHTDTKVEKPDAETDWYPFRDYHIADDADHNNMFVGQQITTLLQCVEGHPERWWRIVYYEERFIETTAGTMTMNSDGSKQRPVTDECRHNVHVEEFQDRNSDGYLELNQPLPIIEEYPRFYTELDYNSVIDKAKQDLGFGDGEKTDPEAKAGEEVEGEDPVDETVHVQDGDVMEVYDELGHKKTIQISVI